MELAHLLENISLIFLVNQWFQHDGAPPHFSRNVQGILNRMYSNRWIGRGGPHHWPARSPDLSPLDIFLWGYHRDHKKRLQLTWDATEIFENLG
jgi:hypothetical protein